MMTTTTENATRVTLVTMPVAEESAVRAVLYGVLSRFLSSRPSSDFLRQVAGARDLIHGDTSAVAQTWHALCDAAGAADEGQAGDEFDRLFVSTGCPAVSLYASSYMTGMQSGGVLPGLRGDLARLGYALFTEEFEDHFSALCDVMRGLVSEDDQSAGRNDAQKDFFGKYLAPWYGRFCEAVSRNGDAGIYGTVAGFVNAFLTHESEYFELA